MAPTLMSLPVEILMSIVEDVLFYERPPVQMVNIPRDPRNPRSRRRWEPQTPSSHVGIHRYLSTWDDSKILWHSSKALKGFRPSVLGVNSQLRRIAIDRILHSPRSTGTYKVEILIPDDDSVVVTWLDLPPRIFLRHEEGLVDIPGYAPGQVRDSKLIVNVRADLGTYNDDSDTFDYCLDRIVVEILHRVLKFGLKGSYYTTDAFEQPMNTVDETSERGVRLRRFFGTETVILNEEISDVSLESLKQKQANAYNLRCSYNRASWDLVIMNCVGSPRIDSSPAISQTSKLSSPWLYSLEDSALRIPRPMYIYMSLSAELSMSADYAFGRDRQLCELFLVNIGSIQFEVHGVFQAELTLAGRIEGLDYMADENSSSGTEEFEEPEEEFQNWKSEMMRIRQANGFEV